MWATKIGFLCFFLAMSTAYAASSNKALIGSSIFVKNVSGFSASLKLLYRISPDKFVFLDMQEELPIGQNQTAVIPPGASAIDFFIVAGVGSDSIQVCSKYYPEMPGNKCYQISGSVEYPLCSELPCPRA